MAEQPASVTPSPTQVMGPRLSRPPRTHNDIFNENPTDSSRRGSPSSASSSTTTSPSTRTTRRPAAVRPRRHQQLPHAPLRPGRDLRTGAQRTNPQFYNASDRDKFEIKETVHNRHGIKRPEGYESGDPRQGLRRQAHDDLGRAPRPRATGKATIADPRNDQTLILLQLHVAFQMFHNKLVDRMRALRVSPAAVFENARRMARWHYQWMVIHEFLPAIVGKDTADSVYREVENKAPIINIKYYKPTNRTARPFIPVEFSVAAYRFGHSMTRARYTVQDVTTASHRDAPFREGRRLKRAAVRGDAPATTT